MWEVMRTSYLFCMRAAKFRVTFTRPISKPTHRRGTENAGGAQRVTEALVK
jgi:hypothetical protein